MISDTQEEESSNIGTVLGAISGSILLVVGLSIVGVVIYKRLMRGVSENAELINEGRYNNQKVSTLFMLFFTYAGFGTPIANIQIILFMSICRFRGSGAR